MKHTVKQLADLSGVSIRTLHWYDKINLLKPSFCGENSYRYYEEGQLLTLQQILFFRELGFTLKNIQKLLLQNNFDKAIALRVHKVALEDEIKRKNRLISTIDKTIQHLKGEQTMQDKELYYGFDSAKQLEYEQYLVRSCGTEAEELLAQRKRRTARLDKAEWDDVKNRGNILHKELANAIVEGLSPESQKVQKIIHQHYQLQNRFFDLTKEVYIGLSQLYADHPEFKKIFAVYHPNMIEFIGKAIRFYANRNL